MRTINTVLLVVSGVWLLSCGGAKTVTQSVDLKDGVSSTDFSLFLYKEMFNDQENMVLSPYSARLLLHSLYPFGGESSHSGIAKILGMSNSVDTNQRTLRESNDRISQINANGKVDIRSANIVWLTAQEVSDTCKNAVPGDNVKVAVVNTDNREELRREVNAWVAENTNGYITDLVTPEMIAESRPVAANATYFMGKWAVPFEPDGSMKFNTGNRESVEASAMLRPSTRSGYYEADDFEVFELTYGAKEADDLGMSHISDGENDVAMMIILPRRARDLAAVANSLTNSRLKEIRESLKTVDIVVRMPKFKIESEIQLTATLNVLPGIFAAPCDFCFCEPPDFCLDNVFQQAVIEVNEEGTVAAAVTMAMDKSAGSPSESIEIHVDRPFIYLIRDLVTGEIYFMGHVVRP